MDANLPPSDNQPIYPLNDVEIELTDNLYGQVNMYRADPATGVAENVELSIRIPPGSVIRGKMKVNL